MSAANATTKTKLVTGDELFAMGDIGPAELIDGRVVTMSPTGGGTDVSSFAWAAS